MNFEETYKTAYSHGLESIYALETIDPRSIKRLNTVKEAVSPASPPRHYPVVNSPQLVFDFGVGFRNWIEPFFLDEPVQVLGLSRHAEKCLLDKGKLILRELIGFDLRQMIFSKGMGQGHLDEIEEKLEKYIQGRELEREQQIDFRAWIRTLCPTAYRKQCAIVLEFYGLEDFVPLSATENLEIRRLTHNQRQDWRNEGMRLLRENVALDSVQNKIRNVVAAFVKPWVAGRKGLATEAEIMERLQKKSMTCRYVEPVFAFFADAFFHNRFPIGSFLPEVEGELYAATAQHQEAFHTVISCAKTYLRFSTSCFTLTHLISLIEREKAKSWQGFEEGFTEKALRLSSHFQVRKAERGHLEIKTRLAPLHRP